MGECLEGLGLALLPPKGFGFGFRVSSFGSRISGFGFRAEGVGCTVHGAGRRGGCLEGLGRASFGVERDHLLGGLGFGTGWRCVYAYNIIYASITLYTHSIVYT